MNRKNFIKTLIGATSLVAIPAIGLAKPVAPTVPVLYGDGIHDDTAALQAWFDGTPLRFAKEVLLLNGDTLFGKKFLISNTIVLKENKVSRTVSDSDIIASNDFCGSCMVEIKPYNKSGFQSCTFRSNGEVGGVYYNYAIDNGLYV